MLLYISAMRLLSSFYSYIFAVILIKKSWLALVLVGMGDTKKILEFREIWDVKSRKRFIAGIAYYIISENSGLYRNTFAIWYLSCIFVDIFLFPW